MAGAVQRGVGTPHAARHQPAACLTPMSFPFVLLQDRDAVTFADPDGVFYKFHVRASATAEGAQGHLVVCHSFHPRPFVRVRCSMHGHTAAERVGRAFAARRRARNCSRTMLRSAKICSIRSSFMCTKSSRRACSRTRVATTCPCRRPDSRPPFVACCWHTPTTGARVSFGAARSKCCGSSPRGLTARIGARLSSSASEEL